MYSLCTSNTSCNSCRLIIIVFAYNCRWECLFIIAIHLGSWVFKQSLILAISKKCFTEAREIGFMIIIKKRSSPRWKARLEHTTATWSRCYASYRIPSRSHHSLCPDWYHGASPRTSCQMDWTSLATLATPARLSWPLKVEKQQLSCIPRQVSASVNSPSLPSAI